MLRSALFGLCSILGLTACGGPGALGGPPNRPSAAAEGGREQVLAVSGPASPLIVDWKPEQRQDLEEAMHDGVAIVAFDNKSMRLLKDCHVDGNYGFLRLVGEVEVMHMESAQQVKANLPLAGATILAQVGAEIDKGTTLEVAMKMVGKKRTTWHDVSVEDLKGSCQGATHFVRGVSVGAFVLDTGTRGKARAAAEVFGAGASYQNGGEKKIRNEAGSLDACKLVNENTQTPPSDCAALIRLELKPISKQAKKHEPTDAAAVATKPEAPEQINCPEGMVVSGGLCVEKEKATTHVCTVGDAPDCTKQCELGDATSCDNLSYMYFRGEGVAADSTRAIAIGTKACDGGSMNACANVGLAKLSSDTPGALALLDKACNAGNAAGCEIAGEVYLGGQGVRVDSLRAMRYFLLACEGGNQFGCTNVGFIYGGGSSEIPRDEVKGLPYTKRACDGGISTACGNLGLKYEFGAGVKQDPKQAVALFERACRLEPSDCIRLAVAYQAGFGVPKKDDAKARALFDVSCQSPNTHFGALSCAVLAIVYNEQKSVPRPALEEFQPMMQPQCDQDVPRACTFLGISQIALGNRTGLSNLDLGCKKKDYWACELKKRLKLK